MDPIASTKRSVDSETQTSPLTPRRSHHHHHHHHHNKYVNLIFNFECKKFLFIFNSFRQQQANTPSRGRRGNQPNVWYNRTAYSQVINDKIFVQTEF